MAATIHSIARFAIALIWMGSETIDLNKEVAPCHPH